jgi:hypothetical protein
VSALRGPGCTGKQAGHEAAGGRLFRMACTEPHERNGPNPNASDSADVESGGVSPGYPSNRDPNAGFSRMLRSGCLLSFFSPHYATSVQMTRNTAATLAENGKAGK